MFLYHSMLWKKCKEKGLNEQNVEIWKGIAMQDIRDILFKDLEGRQYWRDVACRMCMVEVDGTDRLVTSCNTGALTARDNTNTVQHKAKWTDCRSCAMQPIHNSKYKTQAITPKAPMWASFKISSLRSRD